VSVPVDAYVHFHPLASGKKPSRSRFSVARWRSLSGVGACVSPRFERARNAYAYG
jgi:hypothetical protein